MSPLLNGIVIDPCLNVRKFVCMCVYALLAVYMHVFGVYEEHSAT